MKANSILETIGNTPHIRVAKLFPDAEVWVKSERANPGGSIKDRIGLAMIEAAERDGSLKPGGVIVEPTSGNTGIGLAMAAAVKGYKLILVMPESMSLERRRLMLAYGATFDLTPREKGMKGAIERAIELVETTPGAWMPQQFENEANIDVHVRTTGPEILNDFKDTPIDALITRRRHRRTHYRRCAILETALAQSEGLCRRTRCFAGHLGRPACSASDPGASVPASSRVTCIPICLDGVIQVDAADAKEMARRSATEEGMLVGISSGATLAAIKQKLAELPAGSRVLGFNYDTGERYLSVPDFLPEI